MRREEHFLPAKSRLTEDFLPISRSDMDARGWDQLDFLLISGDAYVDHPSFGGAIISRILEKEGFRVGILPQPNWRSSEDFLRMGKPRLAVLITAGNLDSMLNAYTAAKKRRRTDSYSPGGHTGYRPDRASIVYSNRVRELWPEIPLILGGIEASLRRLAHYDYWSDTVRRSILLDCRADLLVYGMGERQIREIASLLEKGVPISKIRHVAGTCFSIPVSERLTGKPCIELPSFEEVRCDKKAFARAFALQYGERNPLEGRRLAQLHGERLVVQNPPALPLTTEELDAIYELPYMREPHPVYEPAGGVPAIEEVRFSLVGHRGCYGECAFCALASHQGSIIQKRSHASLLEEAKKLIAHREFKGYIHDVGGPTANFRNPPCRLPQPSGTCGKRRCLAPSPCSNLLVEHGDYLDLLRALRALPGVKKVFIRSGIRYDYVMADPDETFLAELCAHHVSGQLKVAPEHVSSKVLRLMGKPGKEVFLRFKEAYERMNRKLGKRQFLVPYFLSSHPGSDLEAAVELAEFLRDIRHIPEQVQDFIPTPGSLATCMYYTEMDPFTHEPLYVAKSPREKAMQRALLQYMNPRNYDLVREALLKIGRSDLIGDGPKCLIPATPRRRADGAPGLTAQQRKTNLPQRTASRTVTPAPPKEQRFSGKSRKRRVR
jgi:uncharacterized radical SAM protein YgiQ